MPEWLHSQQLLSCSMNVEVDSAGPGLTSVVNSNIMWVANYRHIIRTSDWKLIRVQTN